jgi:hypothetical protein
MQNVFKQNVFDPNSLGISTDKPIARIIHKQCGTTVKFGGWQGGAEFFEGGILKSMLTKGKFKATKALATKSTVEGLFIYE